MPGQGLQGAAGCVALEDAEAGLCVWAAVGCVPAAEPEVGSLDDSARIGSVAAPSCTGPPA